MGLPFPDSAHDTARQKTEALLRDLWRKKLPMVRDHIATLERAAQILQNATLTVPLRNDAAVSAHKLAGSLGMFGFPEGTRIARELEHLLDSSAEPPVATFTTLLAQLRDALPH